MGKIDINKVTMLVESEIEKAQIVMAVNSEIVEKLQRDAEKIANMKVDILGPVVDRIKAEHGVDPAEAFRNTISNLLDQALNAVLEVKDKVYTETLKLTGDVASNPGIEEDLGLESEDSIDNFEFDDSFSSDEPSLEPVPAEREMRDVQESVQKKIGFIVESVAGRMGEKFFESAEQMKEWVSTNKSKIKSIHGIIKG